MDAKSVATILDKYIVEYLEETKIPMTKQEMYETTEHILPLPTPDNKIKGMIGVNIYDSGHFGERVPSIRFIYLAPEYREPNSFKDTCLEILEEFKRQGYNRLELCSDRRINNWLKKRNSRPIQFVHWQTIDYLYDNIKGD